MAGGAARLLMSGISKSFPGVQALQEVTLSAAAGAICGLVGVNGAGKSTLMNILGGIYRPDAGRIEVDGERVEFHSPRDAARAGIAFIHQELLFFPSQSVAENIFMTRLFPSRVLPLFVSKQKARREAARVLRMLGSGIDPAAPMETLSVGERQVVEIARALAMGSEIVIFDEPTSSLSFKEKENLFRVIRRLRDEGRAIIYITHFLDEILEICDRFVVLRNGRVHGEGAIGAVTKSDLVRMIIGRDIATELRPDPASRGNPVLSVENLRSGHLLHDISFELREGEILGLWGLMGSGRTELLRAIVGLDPIDGGRVRLAEGGVLRPIAPARMLAHCGYVTESRHADGLFLSEPLWKNMTATALGKYASRVGRFLNVRREMATTTDYMTSLRIAAPGHQTRAENLSGGNQQKVVFAKWLNRGPRILLLDEPTRGVDVGAKLEISGLVRALARGGTATLLITSEVEEIVGLSDRVMVLRGGRIAAVVRGGDINNATLMRLALGEETAHG